MSATADIRIYPGKELFASDMAEILRASLVNSGRIQGCVISESDGVLSISSGRIAIAGRVGVVTGGTIPTPALSANASCTVVAICDLSRENEPMRIEMLTADDYATLQANATAAESFNDSGTGIQYVELAYATVNASTGKVATWGRRGKSASSSAAYTEIKDLLTWKKIDTSTGRVDMDVPAEAKELFITAQILHTSTLYYHVNMHLVVAPEFFRSDGKETININYYPSDSYGYFAVGTRIVLPTQKKIKLTSANTGSADVTSSTVWTVYYR